MRRNPYRGRKSQKLVTECLLVALSLIFVAANICMTTWLPSFDMPERFLSTNRIHDESEYERERYNYQKNDDNLLHVVTSRFMQGQPTLNALGKARLRLFETFCLPTMINQDTENFLWFVMTDPELDPELLHRLKSMLEPRPNFYLVASNAKLPNPSNLASILSTELRDSDGTLAAVVHQKMFLTGDIDLLRRQMFDTHRPLLIETRLDADDGLRFDTLSQIQTLAKALPVDTRGWQIICANIHFEWRNDDILAIDSNNTTNAVSPGKLRVVKEGICVTPGYTLVRHREPPSTEFPSWPKLGHHVVTRDWPECRVENATIAEYLETNNGNATFDCWKRMGYYPSALRSRTVTSAGMSRIKTLPEEAEKFETETKMFWEFVDADFHIAQESARSTSQYLKDHLQSIAYDNLKGQCTQGHSCKNSSKTKLEEILASSIQLKNKSIT